LSKQSRGLADGKTTDKSLQHPYYWAGFVLTGNTTPIIGTTNWWLWAILGIGVVVLGLIIYKKKKGKKV